MVKYELKRFSVDFNGAIVAVFDEESAAVQFVRSSWFNGIANIYDHEKKEIIFSEVLI